LFVVLKVAVVVVVSVVVQVVKGPIQLTFYSDPLLHNTGFKMMYAVLPSHLAPQQVSPGVFNCSVPHYYMFQPLLTCNVEVEH
jgi:hypothetical protein